MNQVISEHIKLLSLLLCTFLLQHINLNSRHVQCTCESQNNESELKRMYISCPSFLHFLPTDLLMTVNRMYT